MRSGKTQGERATVSEWARARIREFRFMDDAFMQVCFASDTDCLQEVLRIILDMPDLEVLSVRTQEPLKNLRGRSLSLDVLARDSAGRLYNLEVQRKDVDPRRGRLHGAMVDSGALEAGADFADLPDSYVIFIMERDPFGRNLPLYHFERFMPEIGLPLNDGSHIIYVNGEIRGRQTKLAQLMHDFFCADPDDMYLEPLARVARRFKQDEEGVRKMGSVVEDIRMELEDEIRAKERSELALQLLKMGGFTLEKIAELTRLRLDEVRALIEQNAGGALNGAK